METITRIISPQEDGATVRHILKAELHFSTHAIARLTRAETGHSGQWPPGPDRGPPPYRRRANGGNRRSPPAPGAARSR